jgi:hypothetical protein
MLQRIRLWKLRSKKANALARAAAAAGALSRPGRRCELLPQAASSGSLVRFIGIVCARLRSICIDLHALSAGLRAIRIAVWFCSIVRFQSRGQQARLSNAQRHMPLCEQRSGLPIRPGSSRSAAASALALRSLAPVVPSEPESVVSRRGLTRSWPGSPRGRRRPGRGPTRRRIRPPGRQPEGRARRHGHGRDSWETQARGEPDPGPEIGLGPGPACQWGAAPAWTRRPGT